MTDPIRTFGRDADVAADIARVPGLVVPGPTLFDNEILLPLEPLYLENIYGDPGLLKRLGEIGSRVARDLGADVIVGAETAGIPLATSIAMVARFPSAYVRKRGYRGHVMNEPMTRGADLTGRRVLFVDDAIWRGKSYAGFADGIQVADATIVGVFCLVDMRGLCPELWVNGGPMLDVPMYAPATYDDVLLQAQVGGVLSSELVELIRACVRERWPRTDERWSQLIPGNS